MSASPVPKSESSLPWFWPVEAAMTLQEKGLDLFKRTLDAASAAGQIEMPPQPQWATPNRTLLDMDTMRLRDFTRAGKGDGIPVLIDPPYAGHSSTIADYQPGQSLIETLLDSGLSRVLAMEWKSATPEMRDFDIDKYLAEIAVAVEDLGGRVHLVGLCQGGWMSAMFAARFPEKVASLVLAGSPIDTDAGDGPIKRMAQTMPMSLYRDMVKIGKGRMLGRFMLTGWKNMHPDKQYVGKFIDLFANVEDPAYLKRTETFESWYENPVDLPGVFYLQAIDLLFKQNLFAKGQFTGLGKRLSLKDVHCPLYLLAGEADDITTWEQVFAAEKLAGTPPGKVVKSKVPGGHIGLFMGSRTLKAAWPGIADWIGQQG